MRLIRFSEFMSRMVDESSGDPDSEHRQRIDRALEDLKKRRLGSELDPSGFHLQSSLERAAADALARSRSSGPLSEVITKWDSLPDHLQQQILDIVRSSGKPKTIPA